MEVTITADTIIKLASLLAALGVIGGTILWAYKFVDRNKKQDAAILEMREELTIVCYGLRGALQGLIEKGCDGPCKDALSMLDKHLNKNAHRPEL